jgi:hypothetical protein
VNRPRRTIIPTRPRITTACRIDFVAGNLGRFTNRPYIRDISNGLVIESTDQDYLRRVSAIVNCPTHYPVSNYPG